MSDATDQYTEVTAPKRRETRDRFDPCSLFGIHLRACFSRAEGEQEKSDAHIPLPAVRFVAFPSAPAEGVLMDYLAYDPARHRVWVLHQFPHIGG